MQHRANASCSRGPVAIQQPYDSGGTNVVSAGMVIIPGAL